MQRLTLGKDHEGGKMSIFLKLTLFGGDSAAAAASESAGDTGISPDGGELREAEAAESASKGTEKAEPKDRGADFEKLISGDYKEAFQSKVQSIIDRRFKETKNLEAAVGGMSPIIERLSARYGTKSGDFAALERAIDADSAMWEQLADAEGLTVEQYREKERLKRENAQFRRMAERQRAITETENIYNTWLKEAEKIREIYPDFDLSTEAADSEFISMLSKGVDMKTAYEVRHLESIKQTAAQDARKSMADTIRAQGMRPEENAAMGRGGTASRVNVAKLTKAERRALAERAMRGETITFSE